MLSIEFASKMLYCVHILASTFNCYILCSRINWRYVTILKLYTQSFTLVSTGYVIPKEPSWIYPFSLTLLEYLGAMGLYVFDDLHDNTRRSIIGYSSMVTRLLNLIFTEMYSITIPFVKILTVVYLLWFSHPSFMDKSPDSRRFVMTRVSLYKCV